MLAELQQAMAVAALGGDGQPAAAFLRRDIPVDRLVIHRNNVLGSLAEVLAAAYPSVAHVLGCETFQRAGRGFAASQPPQEPQLWSYGEGFAEFLEAQPAGRVPPWLPDLARLDRAMHQAYFAHDAEPLEPNRLAHLTAPAALAGLRLAFHPSARLLASVWPVHSLWRACRDGGPMPACSDPGTSPEAALVARPRQEVLCRAVGRWQAAFLATLMDGCPLEVAAGSAPIDDPATAVQDELVRLLQAGLITGFATTL